MCDEVVHVLEIINIIVNFVNYTSTSTREVYVIFSGSNSFTSLIWLLRVSYRIRLHVPITYELPNSSAISSCAFQIMAYHAHKEYTSFIGVIWREVGGGAKLTLCVFGTLRNTQIRKRGKIGLNYSLIQIHPFPYPNLFAPVQFSNQTNNWVSKNVGGVFAPLHPAPKLRLRG
jgi:hypothetical protein